MRISPKYYPELQRRRQAVGCVERTAGTCRCVSRTLRFQFVLLAMGLALGCGRGPDIQRAIVSGKVSYRGQPIAKGSIRFVPVKGTQGPQAGAEIKDGVYRVDASGGVPVGTLKVEVQAFRQMATHPNGSSPLRGHGGGLQQYLPDQYNRQSSLEVHVEGTGEQTRDFDLK
jgi:hypothetical protein